MDESDEEEMSPLPINSYGHHLLSCSNRKKNVKYWECLRNHAAAMGGNARDGCGEFLPSGEENTIQNLSCSVCNCHRNFHRQETQGDLYPYHYSQPHFTEVYNHEQQDLDMDGVMMMMMPNHHHHFYNQQQLHKKRFRTKFSAEQKERMLSFAENIGWKLQKQEDGAVQQFCQEIGVNKRVLKVWMHNNKQNLAKKNKPSTGST